jgi:hypothetical protein
MIYDVFLQQVQHSINDWVGGISDAFKNFGSTAATETRKFISVICALTVIASCQIGSDTIDDAITIKYR